MKKMSIDAGMTRFYFSFVENAYDFLSCSVFLPICGYFLIEGGSLRRIR